VIISDLDDLYRGVTKKLSFARNIVCPSCRGTGAFSPSDVQMCTACQVCAFINTSPGELL